MFFRKCKKIEKIGDKKIHGKKMGSKEQMKGKKMGKNPKMRMEGEGN